MAREKIIKKAPFKITETKNFIRLRIKDPGRFTKGSLRTTDPGRVGFTKVVIGRPKGKRKTATQAILFNKKDLGRAQAIGLAEGQRKLRIKRRR